MSSFAQRFEVKGCFAGMKNGAMVTITKDITDTLAVAKVHDDAFVLTGEVTHPCIVMLSIDDDVEYAKGQFPRQRAFSFMLYEGNTIVEAPCYDSIPLRAGTHEDMVRMRNNVKITGTPAQQHYEQRCSLAAKAELEGNIYNLSFPHPQKQLWWGLTL